MLVFMTTSRERARESSDLDDGRRMLEIPARSPDAMEALVGSSDVPLAAVDLPSGRFLAVNPAMAGAVGSTVSALTGSSSLDWLSPDDRHAAQLGFQALADGDLTGYQATRRLADPDQVFSVWVSTVDVDGARVGLTSVIPSASLDSQFRALPPVSSVPEPGNVVLGTVDSSWRVDRISRDVTPLLGLTSEQCAGQPVLGVIHPSDLPSFLAAVEHARRGERAVRLMLRVSARPHDWTEITVVLATIAPGDPPPLAFAATASRPTAVLTSALHFTSDQAAYGVRHRVADNYDMIRVGLRRHPLTATAVVAWSGDLPRHLQQVLFDTADAEIHPADLPPAVAS